MKNKICALCKNLIPDYSKDRLMEMGYNGVYDNFTKKHHIFCPNHKGKTITKFIIDNKIGIKFSKKEIQNGKK